MRPSSGASKKLIEIMAGQQMSIPQLIEEGACIKLNCDRETLRYHLDKLVAEKLAKKVKLPQQRIKIGGRQFGSKQPLLAYKPIEGVGGDA